MKVESTQDTFELVRDNMAQTPFHQWLKPRLIAADGDAGAVTIHLTLRPEFRRLPDRLEIHGGVLAAMIDLTGHATVAAKLRHGVSTIDLRVDYLRLAGGAELRATGTAIKIGRTIGIVDVRVMDDQDRLVAVGRSSYLTASV
jgi:uncharacterized protein (TIGR00369 family)